MRAELATLLQREAKDPRLARVTVSAVRLTADLRQGRVFFRLLDAAAPDEGIQRALERATPFLRAAIGRALRLRVTPTLRFEYDTTPDTARRVDELLRRTTEGAPGDTGDAAPDDDGEEPA
jgi:ribosome-binding factor A